ncbi:hypothetical protein B0I35DRAFT_459343 [Stachybotrys elegans]|uniref:PA14 domain-containing protein n=1 Tax=Stachybotrys elegans TaxID=80388 RepID=A0A8K0WTF3_9HYPO|nr:hypothetical protein B0I35DRAFT_459343 [Stachybotrys elegans]
MKCFMLAASLVALAAAGPCNNNCGRAVAGTARANPPFAARSSSCAQFAQYYKTTTTVTPPAVTKTVPIYQRRDASNTADHDIQERANPIITRDIPPYASSCPNVEAYWNACQCFSGISATVVTVVAPTPTVTVPAGTCTQGIQFAIYAVDKDPVRKRNLANAVYRGPYSVDLRLQFSGRRPSVSGVTPTIGSIIQWVDNYHLPVHLYGVQGPPGSTMGYGIVDHRGYLVPSMAGDYTIYLDTADNAFYAWVGNNAQSSWNLQNAVISRFWPPDAGKSYSYTIHVNRRQVNRPIAIRFLWLNYGLAGAFSARIVDPRGTVILGQNSVKNRQIIASCSGSSPLVPGWGPWGDEQ